MNMKKMKAGDRVRRKDTEQGNSLGFVKTVRSEVANKSKDAKDKNLIVMVQWDNGTTSFFAPEGLTLVEE